MTTTATAAHTAPHATRFKCCHPDCPGFPYRASNIAHPCGTYSTRPQKGRPLRLGMTAAQQAMMSHPIDAVVNARGGQLWRNDFDVREETDMQRDAYKVRDHIERRVRIYQFDSRHFRRRAEMRALLANRSGEF